MREPAGLLDALLDSWDRNNRILIDLLSVVPDEAFDVSALDGTMTIQRMITHIHYCRAIFAYENAPDIVPARPSWEEIIAVRDRSRIAAMLDESARQVREAVRTRVEAGRQFDQAYDHPILFIQHMIWHEGYHHGQIKLALKRVGRLPDDQTMGPLSWDHWDLRAPSS
jgi:uncharacterized damage-inducible protein DinB